MLRISWPLSCALVALPLAAQSPVTGTLLKDLNTGAPYRTRDSLPHVLAAAPGRVWFAATSATTGREVWTTDGTTNGTVLLGDLTDGPASSTQTGALRLPNGRVLVMSTSTAHGAEPFVSDPASPGLQVLADLMPGTDGSSPSIPVLWNGAAWFAAETPAHGTELWHTDGTAAGTALGGEILPGPASEPIDAQRIHVAGGKLFLVTGSLPGQLRVKTTANGPAIILATLGFSFRTVRWYGVEVAGQLVFPLESAGAGTEPWITDGTQAGTRLLADLSPGAASSEVVVLAADGQRVWFQADTTTFGRELWVTDGTTAGTRLVADLVPGLGSSLGALPTAALLPNGDLLFAAYTDSGTGTELWQSDGSATGTRLVADLVPGADGSNPLGFRRFGATAFFGADSPAHGRELWRYDLGTAPVRVTDIAPGTADSNALPLAVLGTGILLTAREDRHGIEPWITAGTPGTERLLADLDPDPNADSEPHDFVRHRDRLVFAARDDAHGIEPWSTDGTAAGTQRLGDLEPGVVGSAPALLGDLPGGVLLAAWRNRATASALWLTDGTPGGTQRLADLPATSGYVLPGDGWRLGDRLVFAVPRDRTVELWTSDGTAAGTGPLPGSGGHIDAVLLAAAGGRAFGFVRDATIGDELLVTDGTAAGTAVVDLHPGPGSSSPRLFAAVGDGVVFTPYDPVEGIELWFAGGQPLRVGRITSIGAGLLGTQVRQIASLGDRAVFTGWDPTANRYELWRTDGTTSGTVRIGAGLPPDLAATATWLTAAGGNAFFWAQPVRPGATELWITDGTTAGTRQVAVGVTPGFGFVSQFLYAVGDGTHVAFGHADPHHGRELWITDGTAAGTRVLTDSAAGPAGSAPEFVARVADRLVFAADDTRTGRELHAVELGAAGAWVASAYGEGCGASIRARGRPVLGATFTIDTATAAGAPVAFLFGPRAAWSPLAPGCSLQLRDPVTVAISTADPAGVARLPVAVPQDPLLVGDLLHFQAFAAVPGGPLFGAVAGTPGLEVVVGR